MSRKNSKKLNRKTRKIIRRTVGALCLVMALIVAAIPTGQSAAAGGTSTDTSVAEPTYSASDFTSASWNFLKESTFSGATKYKGYTIRELSTGSYYLDWAYEFYKSPSGNVITQFNTGYSTIDSALTVDVEVVTDYPQITIDQFNTYITTHIDTPLTADDLKMYFPLEYNLYLQMLEEDPSTPLPSHTVSDLTEEQRKSYYCEHNYYAGTSNTYKNCILTPVYDITNTDEVSNVVYIPYNPSSRTFYETDNTKAMVNYIGEGAFRNVTNISNLIIPADIYAIGDSAFEGVTGIKALDLSARYIGNHAFEGCTGLNTVAFSGITERLGTEAFRGCNSLSTVRINDKMEYIGEGAFAFCRNLKTLDMSRSTTNFIIEKYAFYDCYSLNTVSFAANTEEIHEGAFAVTSSATGTWNQIEFPPGITLFGDYILSGRANATNVVMSASYGSSTAVTLGAGFFRGCVNLETVEFPDTGTGSCQSLSFPTNAFIDVLTENFYLIGPGYKQSQAIASPRESARKAGITYRFKGSDGNTYYEASNGSYMYLVNDRGSLEDCTLLPGAVFDGEITVPSVVGEIKINNIGASCFDDEEIRNALKILTIEDDSVSTIAPEAFKGYTNLEKVYIGNTVTNIGNSAFEGCIALKDVYFATPKNGYGSLVIGNQAFQTGGSSLIFHGDINTAYAPFQWAMAEDNYMDRTLKIRVCYISNEPSGLMVMRDEETGLITLLDYPHYELLEDGIRTAYEDIYVNHNDESPYVLTAAQLDLVEHTMKIKIPAGVESIDVKGYIEGNGNRNNVTTYLQALPYYKTYKEHGLFNGYYGNADGGHAPGASAGVGREFAAGDEQELVDQGNDRITSIQMTSVKSLPDEAFYSCENLQELSLGPAMQDIGRAPVGGCTDLSSISGNDKYVCENGIIYSTNSDGTLRIEEVLSGRGDIVGEKYVTSKTDSNLTKVSQIADGAFRYCGKIAGIDFGDCDQLKVIPAYCFDNCTSLRSANLPQTLGEIKEYAFTNTTDALTATIRGYETQIDNDAFDRGNAVIRTYKDTAAAKYAISFGQELEYINDCFSVQFLDYDGTPLCDTQMIEPGMNAKPPANPSREGYVFTGWSGEYISVTEDRILIAQYSLPEPENKPGEEIPTPPGAGGNNGNGNGNGNGQNTGNIDGSFKLTVENGTGSGTYKAGTVVTIKANEPESGKVFSKWTCKNISATIKEPNKTETTVTMPAADVTVTASYVNASSNNSGSGNGSNSGNSGNSGNSSSGGSGSGSGGSSSGSGSTIVDVDDVDFSNPDKAGAVVDGSKDNFVVRITYKDSAKKAVEAALMDEYDSLANIEYCAFDITLYDETGTKKIEDTADIKIRITIPIPDDLIMYAGNNKAAAVDNAGDLEILKAKFITIDGVPCISFKATHFSPYTIYVDKSNLTSGVTDKTPQTGDFSMHPKWFLCIGLVCLAVFLFLKKDKRTKVTANAV